MVLISPLYSYYIIKVKKIAFLIFINNLLLLYFSESDIFNLINILSVLTTVAAAAAVAAAAFAVTEVYEVVVACVGTGFSSFFIVFFIS